MTFCFAFSANPDGIAVIADTRITLDASETSYRDTFQKVFFPTENSFVAVAGRLGTLGYLLHNLAAALRVTVHEKRIDRLLALLKDRFLDGISRGEIGASAEDGASVIYGDVRFKAPNSCRLLKCDLYVDNTGRPHLNHYTAPKFGWVAAGLSESTRNFIARTAAASLEELEAEGLKVETMTGDEVQWAKTRRKWQSYVIRDTVLMAPTRTAVRFNLDVPTKATFRKNLRAFANAQEKNGQSVFVEPIFPFAGIALQAVMDQVAVFRQGMTEMNTVSDLWSVASISRRSGIRLFTTDDPAGLAQLFCIRTGLP